VVAMVRHPRRLDLKYFSVLVATLILANCSSDQTEPFSKCSDQELYDQLTDKCVPRIRDVVPDAGPDKDTSKMDVTPDEGPVVLDMGPDIPGPECDKDHDGELSKECGGNDCDDNVRQMSPNFIEVCDTLDNNCDGIINNGINCSFFAHTGRTGNREPELYRVDPFLMTAKPVGSMITIPGGSTLLDIDTHPNGILYGISSDELFRFDEAGKTWSSVGKFGQITGANGLAIDSEGTAFVTGRDEVYTVDVNDGSATLLGKVGGEFFSSGDCVVNKQDTLYMTSKNRDPEIKDELVLIDRRTAVGTLIGSTGFKRIYGLTAGWGELWGLTAGTFEEPNGQLIKIDPNTGQAELVHTFEGIRWFGSASDPNR